MLVDVSYPHFLSLDGRRVFTDFGLVSLSFRVSGKFTDLAELAISLDRSLADIGLISIFLCVSGGFTDFDVYIIFLCIWTASSEFGTYRLCEQQRFRRACASAQSRQNLRCSLISAVSQEVPSDRKPDPSPL